MDASVFLWMVFCLPAQSNQVPDSRSPLKAVQFAVKSTESRDGRIEFEIAMTIKDGHFVFANPVDNLDFNDIELRVIGKGTNPPKLNVIYPAPSERVICSVIGNYSIYRKNAVLRVSFEKRPEIGPFDIVVRFHVHTNEISYPPGRFTIPVFRNAK